MGRGDAADLLADHRITYLKWDMNRPVSDGGRPGDAHGRQWAVQHAEGYTAGDADAPAGVPRTSRSRPAAAGGGRIDAAVLALSDVVWPSDETGPRDRLAIQHGFLSAYGPHVMSSWVTDEPDRLDTSRRASSSGSWSRWPACSASAPTCWRWGPERRARAAELITLYRDLRPVIHCGRVELHGEPTDPVYAVEYGTPDRTVILVYGRPGRPDRPTIMPKTLQAGRSYRLADGRPLTAGQPIEVPFALAADADVLIIEPIALDSDSK